MRVVLCAASLLVVLTFTSRAFAYRLEYCDGSSVPLRTEGNTRLMFVAQDVVESDWWSRIETAFEIMNHNASAFNLWVWQGQDPPDLENTVTEVYWATGISAPMTTPYVDCATNSIVAADVRLPSDYRSDYVLSDNKNDILAYVGREIEGHKLGNYITSAFLHELGHVAGLAHTPRPYSLMGQNTRFVHANGSTLSTYIGTDTNQGLYKLYGAGAPYADLSVSHWKLDRESLDEEISRHQRVEVFDAADNLVANDWGGLDNSEDAPQFQLVRGQTYYFEFTWENNGLEQLPMTAGLYLSDDDWIDPADRLLSVATGTIEGLDTTTSRVAVPMPSDVEVGRSYYVGAVMDPDNQLEEQDEFNGTYTLVTFVE